MKTTNLMPFLLTISCAAYIFAILGACQATSLGINPPTATGQLCEGNFVSGEPMVLCRRISDGALGGYEVFLEEVVVDASGTVFLADRVVIGTAEITQTFDEDEGRSQVFWQIKAPDNTLLQLQEIALLPDVVNLVAAGDRDVIEALTFVEFFVQHYLFNANQEIAAKNSRVYGIDDFLACLGTEPASRDGVCYTLYDQAPSGAPDGTLNQEDFKALARILNGEDDGVGETPFSIEQFLACKQGDFNFAEGAKITRECAALDTNASATVDDVDLRNLLLGEVPDNFAPVAIAGKDQEVGGGEVVILNGRDSFDIDSATLGFLWEQIGGVAVELSQADTFEARFTSPVVESGTFLTFRLTVGDGAGRTDSDTVTIETRGESLDGGTTEDLLADAGANQQVSSGDLVTLNASGSVGQGLTFQWLQVTGVLVDLSALDTEEPVFVAPVVQAPTVLRFQLTVSDGQDSTSDIVDITVLPPAPAP